MVVSRTGESLYLAGTVAEWLGHVLRTDDKKVHGAPPELLVRRA
jgi:hypothetical protein